MPTCFVITGYGIKKDYINNRDIDLDKSFKYIIKPVFEELGYECKRSSDYPPGMIDTIMYKGIYDADFVIADISTLNPNALYELGVRHALKPYTTLVICEDGIFINNKLPFDLSHLTALSYRHDGKALDVEVVENFKQVLKTAITGMVKSHNIDSPVFTHLKGLQVQIEDNTLKPAKNTMGNKKPAMENIDKVVQLNQGPTLSEMVDSAVAAIKSKKFTEAITAFTTLLKLKPGNVYFTQQLCLATYKADNSEDGYKKAYTIVETLNPETSTDTETLGMAGAINKNLYNFKNDTIYLERSLKFYERGYYIANDYYNGINAVFLYWKLASLANNKEQTFFYKMRAKQIGENIVAICSKLRQEENYNKRSDKEWITNTLAEAYYGLDDTASFDTIIAERKALQSDFSEAAFVKQFDELKKIKENVEAILK